MSNQTKPETGNKTKKTDDGPTFWEWLWEGKGTVSEPWPTAEEVLKNPELKKEIQAIHNTFNKKYKEPKNPPSK